MTLLQAILLALVQGVTEFLPISSSAHLILVPYFVGWPDQGLVFDALTNAGTLLAVLVYFRRDLVRLLHPDAWLPGGGTRSETGDGVVSDVAVGASAVGAEGDDDGSDLGGAEPRATGVPLGLALAIGTVPLVITGLVLLDWIGGAARNAQLIAATSIGFGLLLWWSDRGVRGVRDLDALRWRHVMLIGCAQALALVPGTSRSGITITAALMLGFRREAAARFSFLLAVPAGLAATVVDLRALWLEGPGAAGWAPLVVAFLVAAASAYLVIDWLLDWVRNQDLTIFVVYRVALGLLILGLGLLV
ncbi:MAG: undecaprenyl-diphosphate phosphatase [Acidobacteriota bacterium]